MGRQPHHLTPPHLRYIRVTRRGAPDAPRPTPSVSPNAATPPPRHAPRPGPDAPDTGLHFYMTPLTLLLLAALAWVLYDTIKHKRPRLGLIWK